MTHRNASADDTDPTHPSVIRGTLGKRFLTGLANDFARHGGRLFRKLRRRRQQDYLKLVMALLPKEFRVKEVEVPEEQFEKVLQALNEVIAEKEKQERAAREHLLPFVAKMVDDLSAPWV